jgi:N-acetylmuramoyl-L-alanine amidase
MLFYIRHDQFTAKRNELMINFYKVMSRTVVALLSIGGLTAIGIAAQPVYQLPATIYEEASSELEITIPYDPPETDETPETPFSVAPGTSLASLVSQFSQSQTASTEDECLAVAVYFEAKGEPFDGQLAVARTVMNRAKSGRFPNSLCGVVMQRSQFSFVRRGGFPPIDKRSKNWRQAVAIAYIARENLYKSRISDALFFHAAYVSPGWKLTRIAAVGNHIFYR